MPSLQVIHPNHKLLISRSAISAEVAAERGYRTVISHDELLTLGFSTQQALAPGLLLPLYGVDGRLFGHQLRPDQPRTVEGRIAKYETVAGLRLALDVPSRCCPSLADPKIPLFITEGVRKADSAASHGLCCIDLLGVWGWRGTNEHGGKTALPDWESIALNDRTVFIAFDSDVTTKIQVHRALERLKKFLERRGAKVLIIYLPEEV